MTLGSASDRQVERTRKRENNRPTSEGSLAAPLFDYPFLCKLCLSKYFRRPTTAVDSSFKFREFASISIPCSHQSLKLENKMRRAKHQTSPEIKRRIIDEALGECLLNRYQKQNEFLAVESESNFKMG